MSTIAVQPERGIIPSPPTNLIETDGEPLESDWHRLAMNLLIDVVSFMLRGREDYFVGGNMFIYFNERQARDLDYRGPDFFFVWGRPLNPPRPYWAIWDEEGRYPDVIIELSSPRTAKTDRTTKKQIYEKTFHTHEYFIYDPDDQSLQGWRLVNNRHEPITPSDRGWLWCEELGVWLGACESEYSGKRSMFPRFFNVAGDLLPTSGEGMAMEAAEARKEADAAAEEAATAKREREVVEQRALQAEERFRQRADAAEAEVAELKAKLAVGGAKNEP